MPCEFVFMLLSLLSLVSLVFQGYHEMQFENLLKKLLVLDSIALLANVEVFVVDENTCEELVETKGPGAQSLVDLLHAVYLPVVCAPCCIDMSI
jgi:hypothetical protein